MSTETNFDRTKAAIQRYERFRIRWEREFERNINAPDSYLVRRAQAHNLDINEFVLAYFRYMVEIKRRVVGDAFAADTSEFNNRNTVLEGLFPLNGITSKIDPFILKVAA